MRLHEEVVRREIELDADVESAWSALADAEGLEAWLAASVDVEIEPGAEGTITDNDGTVRDTVVEEVVPGRRVALRWAADGEEPSIVELTLDPLPGGRTRLVVVELPLAVVRAVSTQIVAAGGSAFQGPALVAA